jgi:CheY-like chemotaxis protein/two-component sensor histidine kinase
LLAERGVLLQQVRAASEAKDEFLAMLGHELRNPLAPIVTALELLRGRERHAHELDVIDRQTRHLVRLVDDLLDVSRISRGRVELHRQAVPVADVVAKAFEMVERLFEQRQQRVTVSVPAGMMVDADPTRLAQVIANLLHNAAKYTPVGGAVDVIADSLGGEVMLRVCDDGIGIAPQMLPHVFDMFVQERQAPDRSRGGLGLGLTIVKSLVAAHGGTIVARSDGRGRGSTFELRMPAATARSAAAPSMIEKLAPAEPSARILVVDDNEDAATMLAETLEHVGYATVTAHDAGEALAAYAEFMPAAAILDIGLPVVDGYELARRIRALPGAPYLIALTGYGQPSDRERALEAGFDHHLVKPVSVAAIRSILAEAVSGIPAAE